MGLLKQMYRPVFRLIALWLYCVFCLSARAANVKEVINPHKFSEPIAQGYRAALKAKDVCSKLFCYCGCDLTDEHKTLLDCFTSMHGVDCAICQEEAVIALHLKEQGKSLGQIQKVIDDRFSPQYPWEEVSPALKEYFKTIRAYHGPSPFINDPRTTYSAKAGVKSLANKKSRCCGH